MDTHKLGEKVVFNNFYLQPLKSIHLHSHINAELDINSDIRYIYNLLYLLAYVLLKICENVRGNSMRIWPPLSPFIKLRLLLLSRANV